MVLSPFFVTPAIFKPGSMVLKKIKGKIKNVDSRLKISGMTKKGVIPEWFYEGSKSEEGKPSLFCHREERLRWRSRFSEPQNT